MEPQVFHPNTGDGGVPGNINPSQQFNSSVPSGGRRLNKKVLIIIASVVVVVIGLVVFLILNNKKTNLSADAQVDPGQLSEIQENVESLTEAALQATQTADSASIEEISAHLVALGTGGVAAEQVLQEQGSEGELIQAYSNAFRFAGGNRYETAVNASQSLGNASTVIFVNGDDEMDLALATSFQGRDRIILPVKANEVPEVVWNEFRRVDPDQTIIIGGTASISTAVENRIKGIRPSARRIAGANDYALARAIADARPRTGLVFLAAADAPADVIVANNRSDLGPLLLIDNDQVPETTAQALQSLDPETVIFVGGTARIDNETFDRVGNIVGRPPLGIASLRQAPSRLETAAEVAAIFYGTDLTQRGMAVVVNGFSIVDSAIASMVAGHYRVPLFFVNTNEYSSRTVEVMRVLNINTMIFIGGEAAISTDNANRLRAELF